ncbi:protein kinase [Nannocystis sp. ILAH1]|uniref:protein kinase domain-containing protein n=1 Tax=unclassified Nannocystis TaxID=2627009 RepID=UPI0022701BA5|nr:MULTISPECIES: protein kinase [unclassified Nannocystis]MCY0992592.1 protein kinase [Nannocystis sp. ILAH1]MCY1070182.1 protein kinase [Nannocystis sp. RBIL2]
MDGCPEEEAIAAYLEGDLSAAERAALDGHLEACTDCRVLLAGLARGQVGARVEDDRSADPMTGVVIGRYTLADLLGSGGMGLVYRAHDPVLERDVAVKLIHALDVRPADRERLLREARAMARLSHPNVLTVFDAGESGDELFVAMALVRGSTLREHCARKRPDWREVATLCLGAARGLAASHRAGVLHRDVKPDNILVGEDGGVQVTDFGLAREMTDPGTPLWPAGSESGRAGTPGYMAPELRAGGEPTAASDQYAFCLTLKECLGRVPRRLERIVRRGLAERPADRYPSMDALVVALAAATERRWPRVAGLLAFAAVVAAAVVWALPAAPEPQPVDAADPCDEPRARMGGLWNPAQAQRLRAAVARAGLARGELLSDRLQARLDEHAGRWIEMRTQLCRDADEDRAIAARRIACLEEGYDELAEFFTTVDQADRAVLQEVEWLSYGLTTPERCAAGAPVSLLPSPDPAVREEVARARRELRAARAVVDGDRLDAALASVRAIEATARRVGYLPLAAAALNDEADLLMRSGDLEGSRARLEAAAELAEACGDDTRRATVLVNLVVLLGVGYWDPDAALVYAARAWPLVERLQLPILEGELWRVEGQALLYKGDAAGARDRLQRALEVWERTLVGDHDTVMTTLIFLGASAQQLGAWEAADDYQRRAHEMAIRLHGERHPTTASVLRDWANGVLNQAEEADAPDERERLGRLALAKADRAAVDLEASLGVDNPEGAQAQLTRCRTLWVLRELDRAASACEQALAVLRRAHDADSPQLTEPLLVLGVVQHARGELGPARDALAEALTRGAAGNPYLLADVQFELAKVLGQLGQTRRAIELARAARPTYAADARTGETLAELDAWLAAQRPARRAPSPAE